MKAYLIAALAALFAWPVAAFEKHELDLSEGEYHPATGMTGYKVNGPEICFKTFEEHKAYVDKKGLVFGGQFRVDPLRVIVIFNNKEGTYREVYLVTVGIGGCLKAVGYAEGAPV